MDFQDFTEPRSFITTFEYWEYKKNFEDKNVDSMAYLNYEGCLYTPRKIIPTVFEGLRIMNKSQVWKQT